MTTTTATRRVIRANRQILSGEELALQAMENELKRLIKVAQRAKKECDECNNAPSLIIECYKKACELSNKKPYTPEDHSKMEELAKIDKKARAALKKDIIKLIDKQCNAEFAVDKLRREIQSMKFMLNLRQKIA